MIPPKYWSPTKKLMVLGAMAGGKLVEDTATDNPLTFVTDLAKPLKSLLIPFTPVQSGSGDPSPSNIRSILPWNGLTVWNGGKNLLNPVAENSIPFQNSNYNKYTLTDGVVVTSGNTLFGFKAKVKPNTVYRFTFDTSEAITMEIFAYTAEPTVIKNDDKQIININSSTWEFTTFSDTEWISCCIYTSKANVTVKDFRLTAGSAQEAYEPYHPITETDIVFPSAVYGGTLDVVSGVLTVEWAFMTKNTANMDGFSGEDYPAWRNSGIKNIIGENYNNYIPGAYCNVAPVTSASVRAVGGNTNNGGDTLFLLKEYFGKTQDEWKALALDIQFAIPLATPQEIQLTPQQITALVGDNTIWSDADGSMTAVYLKKG